MSIKTSGLMKTAFQSITILSLPTLASLSSFSIALCSRTTHTYSFPERQERGRDWDKPAGQQIHHHKCTPAPCCDLTRRVALSMHTIRHPVTCGSSVPLWPVFSTRKILRIQATTCNNVVLKYGDDKTGQSIPRGTKGLLVCPS